MFNTLRNHTSQQLFHAHINIWNNQGQWKYFECISLEKCHFSWVISASTSHHQIQARSIDRDEIVLQLMLETINGKPTTWPENMPVQRLCTRKTSMQLDNVLNVPALMCSKQSQIFLLKTYTMLQRAAAHRNNKAPLHYRQRTGMAFQVPAQQTVNVHNPNVWHIKKSKRIRYRIAVSKWLLDI